MVYFHGQLGSPRILLIMEQEEASCPKSLLTAAMGIQSSPTHSPLLLATGSPEGYICGSPTYVCLLLVRYMWHFRPLLSWNKVILPEEPVVGLMVLI